MTRHEFILRLVLNRMVDDDECIEQIAPAMEDAKRCGLSLSHQELLDALRELIEKGYAKARDYEPRKREPPKEYPGLPPVEDLEPNQVCFLATREGLDFRGAHLPLWAPGDNLNRRTNWIGLKQPIARAQLLPILALDAIWDGFTILHFVRTRMEDTAGRRGITISPEEVIHSLGGLIDLGYAKAWHLDRGDPPKEYDGMPPVEHIVPYRAYFYATQEGLDFHRSNDTWSPFDDDDNLRPHWTPPT